MNKRVVIILIILILGFFSFERLTGFVVYDRDKNITIEETFIQNLDVENAKFYDTNNNGMIDKIELKDRFSKIKINSKERERVIINYKTGNFVIKELTKNEINNYLKDANIKSISLDSKFNLTLQNTVPLIKASSVHSIVINNNITGSDSVCILDSGIYSEHPDFNGRILAEKCYADDDFSGNGFGYCSNSSEESDDANEDIGHGTIVAGIVSASGIIKGVAPSVNLVVVKICNYAGQCQYSDLIKGINFCIANKNKYNISVITLSLGTGYTYSDEASCNLDNIDVTNAINDAYANGIFVDVSSGNSRSSTGVSSPGCLANVSAVGATDKSDNIASYSNIGDLMDVLAPGSNINSTSCISGGSLCSASGYTNRYSGTSFASPHVAGAAILLKQYASEKYGIDLSPDEIRDILKSSGKIINYNAKNYSRIDVLSAINYIDISSNESLNVWADSSLKEYLENTTFYANFTIRNEIADASCNLSFENETYNMNLNNDLYKFSKNITEFKDYNFSITCNNLSADGFISAGDFKFYLNHSLNIFVKNFENKSLNNIRLLIYEFNETNYLYNETISDNYNINLTEFLYLNNTFINKTPHTIIVYYNDTIEERNLTMNQSFDETFYLNITVENNTLPIVQPSTSASSGGGGGGSSTKETKAPQKYELQETKIKEEPKQITNDETRVLEKKQDLENGEIKETRYKVDSKIVYVMSLAILFMIAAYKSLKKYKIFNKR